MTNFLRFVRQLEPQRLSGEELAYLRQSANELVKTGDEVKVNVGATMIMLLNHIDHITLEAMRK